MKRNMDVVRKIVLALRESDEPIDHVDGIEEAQYLMHAELLIEAGLAEGEPVRYLENASSYPSAVTLTRLTWQGQDFADAIDDDTLWTKAKVKVIKPGASWTFSLLLEWLKAEARTRLGLP